MYISSVPIFNGAIECPGKTETAPGTLRLDFARLSLLCYAFAFDRLGKQLNLHKVTLLSKLHKMLSLLHETSKVSASNGFPSRHRSCTRVERLTNMATGFSVTSGRLSQWTHGRRTGARVRSCISASGRTGVRVHPGVLASGRTGAGVRPCV